MKSDIQPHQSIREYLLGQSASEDAARIEERLLTDDDLYQELLIVEDELVDQYLVGQLTDFEKESFEQHFLASAERRQKLRFARNLKRYVAGEQAVRRFQETDAGANSENASAVADWPPTERRIFRWIPFGSPAVSYSVTAALIVIVALSSIVIFKKLTNPAANRSGKVLAVELLPGLSRGEEGLKEITVPPDTATVGLQLRIPNMPAYQTYRGILKTSEGREISQQDDLRRDPATNDRVIYPVPANRLKASDYSLKLSGLNQQGEYEDIARYSFRVTK